MVILQVHAINEQAFFLFCVFLLEYFSQFCFSDLASALKSAQPTTKNLAKSNSAIKNQLHDAKAGQAIALKMINGELQLSPTEKNGTKFSKLMINKVFVGD